MLFSYPYGIRTPESESIFRLSGARLSYVRADWFAANASVAPLYHDLLGLPGTVGELERLLSIDATRDLAEEKNVVRGGVRVSAVSQNNRVLERHESPYGAYWKSLDFRSNLGGENIFKDPLRLSPAGGEFIFNLPNGLQAYFLSDGQGRRLDAAPIAIVSDRTNPDDPVIHNGRSCMSCHYAGVQSFKDDVRQVALGPSGSAFDRDKVLALYPEQNVLDRLIERDRERFRAATAKAGARIESERAEEVNALSRRFFADLSLSQASAEVGLDVKEFQTLAARSERLAALGIGQLLVKDGGVRRDTWEKAFGEFVREFRIGEYVQGSTVVSRRALLGSGADQGSRSLTAGFDRDIERSRVTRTDPAELLRSARTIKVQSKTVFLKPEQLENELRKRAEFESLGLLIVKDSRVADLQIDLDRPLFTYTFTFALTHPETSLSLGTGKLIALDGSLAAPRIAKEVLKRVKAARAAVLPAQR